MQGLVKAGETEIHGRESDGRVEDIFFMIAATTLGPIQQRFMQRQRKPNHPLL
jgi:hypothetical protein